MRPPLLRLHHDELIVDSFAGGGGASLGIEWALGRSPDIAINHDAEAIAMHKANHPTTRHLCGDVWDVDPKAVTSGRPAAVVRGRCDPRRVARARRRRAHRHGADGQALPRLHPRPGRPAAEQQHAALVHAADQDRPDGGRAAAPPWRARRDGGECGQGWYQETLPEQLCDTLAPLLHWRVCHVWEWLRHWATTAEFGDWSTEIIADAYGGDEAEEINARTGCVGCPLAQKDTALDTIIARSGWEYLAPLKRLRLIYRELREPVVRLRKSGLELRKDGTPAANPQRMGPIILEARLDALERILAIQAEVNGAAVRLKRPLLDIVNAEEEARIRELIAAKTWPDKWDGDEVHGDVLLDKVFADGTVQPLLPGFGDRR